MILLLFFVSKTSNIEMAWKLSTFDVSGVTVQAVSPVLGILGTEAVVYSNNENGVVDGGVDGQETAPGNT